ncbi:MAG: type IV toxin-antitoxin system AbiEi family antitoxin domain-containing protein [Deltaproteobacteria bacterium]|nr:type IV toxin-antitoxin system AbiEi family antitoxin domain-containing protein [Deltaproteobacteria bacterium]
MARKEKILRFLNDYHIITTQEAAKLDINAMFLSRAVHDGWLYRVARGIYTCDLDLPFDSLKKYLSVTVQCEDAVVALVSALTFHELTDEEEKNLCFALPHSKKFQNQKDVQIIRLSGAAFSLGIEDHAIGNRKVRIYNQEKSIVDAFKYLGEDLAIKSLKNYIKQPKIDLDKLLTYSEKLKKPLHNQVKTIMTV